MPDLTDNTASQLAAAASTATAAAAQALSAANNAANAAEKAAMVAKDTAVASAVVGVNIDNIKLNIKEIKDTLKEVGITIDAIAAGYVPMAIFLEFKHQVEKDYVTRDGFIPVQRIAYGLMAILGSATVVAVLKLLYK